MKHLFTKKLTAIMIALFVSGSLSAQVLREGATPKPMDVSAYQNQIKMRERPDPSQDRDFVTVLEEDFSLFAAGSEENPDTTNVVIDVYNGNYYIDPQYTHDPGWIAYFVYQAGGKAYFGDWYYGFIDTPEFEMAGTVHISFRARLQSGTQCQTFVGLCIDPVNPQIIDLDGFYMTPEWQTYEFDFYNPESLDAFIQINCYDEWFLDSLVVSRELNFTPAPQALDANNYTMEGFDANWTEVATAEDYLLTVFKRDFYGPEQVYVSPESFEDVNNDGQWIDYDDPNFPEGWTIELQEGDARHVTTDAYTGTVALCMDAPGDTIILPYNGGSFLSSNIHLRVLEYNGRADLEIIAKVDGNWIYTGVFYMDEHIYENYGNEWIDDDMLSLYLSGEYDEIGLAYVGEGTVWAIDDWDYSTSQACTINYVYEDIEIEAPTLSNTITGLNADEDHYYYVKARNSEYGESVPSNFISCFGLCPPVIGEATDIHDGCYTANWEAHPKADAYEIHNYYVYKAENDEPNAIIFSEDFVLVHNGVEPPSYIEDDDPMYHRLDQYTVQPDWYGAGVILAEGALGGADNQYCYGRVYTPEITLNNAETYHVKATVWGWQGGKVNIMSTTTGETYSFDYTEDGPQVLEMDFTAGPDSDRERLMFEDYFGYPFLIDNFMVTQDLQEGDKTFSIISWDRIDDGTAESYTYTGLNGYGVEDFAYDIIAFHTAFGDEYASVNSDYVEVTVPTDVTENVEAGDMSVYPNPNNGQVTLRGEDMQRVTVFSLMGQAVFDATVEGDEASFDLSHLDSGIYMVRIETANGISTRQLTLTK